MNIKVIYPVRPSWREFKEQVFDAGEIQADNAIDACQMMFAAFNHVEPKPFENEPGFLACKFRCRSMSVGDICEVEGVRYRCENIGWTRLEEEVTS